MRVLSAKVSELQDEIASGAPSERRIFELAVSQSKRETLHGAHNDTRELAFQQLQAKLAARDLELARAQQGLSALQAEVVELRRTHQRDGINMDYLKNIVIQVPYYYSLFWNIAVVVGQLYAFECTSTLCLASNVMSFIPFAMIFVQYSH